VERPAKTLTPGLPRRYPTTGIPCSTPTFSDAPNASTAWETSGGYTGLNPETTGKLVELNLGLRNTGTTWASGTVSSADLIATDPAAINAMATTDIEPQPKRTMSYADASGSLDRSQDGCSFGYLSTVYVDRDGIMYGKYSNGETLALFQITLYDFTSQHNLHREGGNLFSQTRESGDASSGPANRMSMGSISGKSLEQSNVDLATEFVNMITTQRKVTGQLKGHHHGRHYA
jgi:flagellar hook protein FlgE